MKPFEQRGIIALEGEERAVPGTDGEGQAAPGQLAGGVLPVGLGHALHESNPADEFPELRAGSHGRVAGQGGETLSERRRQQRIEQPGGFVDLQAKRGLAGDPLGQNCGGGGPAGRRDGDQPREEDAMKTHIHELNCRRGYTPDRVLVTGFAVCPPQPSAFRS
jgi:hypothetical protein